MTDANQKRAVVLVAVENRTSHDTPRDDFYQYYRPALAAEGIDTCFAKSPHNRENIERIVADRVEIFPDALVIPNAKIADEETFQNCLHVTRDYAENGVAVIFVDLYTKNRRAQIEQAGATCVRSDDDVSEAVEKIQGAIGASRPDKFPDWAPTTAVTAG